MTDQVIGRQLLVVGLAATLLGALVLTAIVVSTKAVRARRALVRARHLAPHRPSLLLVAAGDDDEDALAALREVPARSRPTVEQAAVHLLGKVKGEPAEALVRVLTGYDAPARALADLRSRRSVRRGRAAVLLGRCGHAEAVDELEGLLADRDPVVRQCAATALGQLGLPRSAPALLAAVRTDGTRSGIPSGVAIDALVSLGYGIERDLAAALADPDPAVRDVAARVVAERTAIPARADVRGRLLAEADPDVQVGLCRALGRLGDDDDVDALGRAARSGASARRLAAVDALGEIDVPRAVPVLAGLLADPDRRTAGAAAQSLAAMTHPDARRALDDLTDERARSAAAYVLALRDLRDGREAPAPTDAAVAPLLPAVSPALAEEPAGA